MKVVKISDVEPGESKAPIFEGGKVYSQRIIDDKAAEVVRVVVINFEPGATTVFHTHDFEQVLYVIAGKGRVATENEEHIVLPSTIVFFPKGERHLHGATADTSFTQLTMTNEGAVKKG